MNDRSRWHSLLTGAAMLPHPPPPGTALADCLAYLDHVLEVFPRDLDPIDDEPGFAVRAMALALRSRLARLSFPESP